MSSDGKKVKAIVLLSGGLDSTLAAKVLLEQGIELVGVNFTSPFCTCSPRDSGCSLAAMTAGRLGIELVRRGKGPDYLEVIRSPRFGYGRGLNPCIDCRIYTLSRAKEIMHERGARFVATGEVLGQRPMSQHMQALRTIERESGLEGLLLRPLSAKLLEPTIPEKEGWVDREKLLAIQGRNRSPQLELAKREGVEVLACGGGGCLLTDPNVAARMRDLFEHQDELSSIDARMATLGRHFRLTPSLKVILGRNEQECRKLEALADAAGHGKAELAGPPGPLAVVCGKADDESLELVAGIIGAYAPKATGDVSARFEWPDRQVDVGPVRPLPKEQARRFRIEPEARDGS
ncbi:MAG: hypothetical protein D6806_07965 [Deltaproteobacteria bacterium]|nr:MAG: hypothetical protein D6806_07965 [Deltaproteobacteria bacterium]